MVTALYFSRAGCPPCVRMKPVIEQLQKENYDIKTGNDEQARKYGVAVTPTIIILNNGSVTNKFEGVVSIEKIRAVMKPKTPDYNIW